MLKEIRCDKLIQNKLEFNHGLNVLVGPDDGANSIGKSSVLMLIDFALAGDDFISLCSDVMDHVGIITVEMDFIFLGVKYSFSRSSNDPNVVNFINEQENLEKSIGEYREFLKEQYGFPEDSASFRSAVNPFFRIWGKDNSNPNKPLNSFSNDPYAQIKKTVLKLFSAYGPLRDLEKEEEAIKNKKKALAGAFDQGYITSLTKKELTKKKVRLEEVTSEVNEIKKSIETYSINASRIINDENLALKSQKDSLLQTLFYAKNRLKRIEDNLQYGSTVNKKHFEKLKKYFPDVDDLKLSEIDQFHSGIAKLLKAELRNEMRTLQETISSLEAEVGSINKKLTENLDVLDKPSGLVDKVLELSVEEQSLRDQIKFRGIKDDLETKVVELSTRTLKQVVESLKSIEKKLNSTMSAFIGRFYEGNPVSPEIRLFDSRYEFHHNDDSGTGKAYANMIALDMSFLEQTYLPALIHDLIVFKNIEVHAIEKIILEYTSREKQIFIAIDELNRYNQATQKLVKDHQFLSLDPDRLAFGISWKKKT